MTFKTRAESEKIARGLTQEERGSVIAVFFLIVIFVSLPSIIAVVSGLFAILNGNLSMAAGTVLLAGWVGYTQTNMVLGLRDFFINGWHPSPPASFGIKILSVIASIYVAFTLYPVNGFWFIYAVLVFFMAIFGLITHKPVAKETPHADEA